MTLAAAQHSTRARRALVQLASEDPALGALALWCTHRDAATGPAARTEGTTIHYGPAFETLPPHEQLGVAAHHVLHVALRHGARMGAMGARLGARFDRDIYALAADAVVNEALLAAGYGLPRPAVTLQLLLGRALGRPAGADALAEWDVDRLYLALTGQGGGRRQGPQDGQALDHAPTEAARQIVTETGFSPDLDMRAPDPESPENADEAALWRQHLARALEAGRLAGRGIGTLGHRIADIPAPRIPWEMLLRRALSRALIEGRSPGHTRPARDWIAAEALARATATPTPGFRPATLRRRSAPRIVLAVDASGSVEAGLLDRFAAEVAGIARRLSAEITLMAFDETVHWQQRMDPAQWAQTLSKADWPRGGGTDFGPPVAEALRMHASALVVLSDLDGPFGPAPRSLPVIWACFGPPPGDGPPFGLLLDLGK
ncbi:VWA domain-containing protein [Rhodobacteraceae bacterium 2376]|uniref:VWA domain-containing protein n=1 Tax=Rhabdonatronobacter sediminivivens TaxID=2743469 RepID=A0A7Z0KYK5_9RHOB|nr:VWA-like domain-containing protein [Rhabdonatronobacter sediminivivens]NYS25414.1 VWA domain-containing protein [Rhabdonatronobacter sediminivivens]